VSPLRLLREKGLFPFTSTFAGRYPDFIQVSSEVFSSPVAFTCAGIVLYGPYNPEGRLHFFFSFSLFYKSPKLTIGDFFFSPIQKRGFPTNGETLLPFPLSSPPPFQKEIQGNDDASFDFKIKIYYPPKSLAELKAFFFFFFP